MSGLILQVLPFAVGAAISPTVLTLEVFILASNKQPKARAWAYALGGAVFTALFFVLVLTFLGGVPTGSTGRNTALLWVSGVAAVLLVILGIRQLMPRKTPGEKHSSRIQQRLQAAGPWLFGVGGFVMMLTDFSSLIIVIPGLHHVVLSDAASADEAIAIAILYIAILLPMVIPVGLVTILGKRSDKILHWLNDFCTRHARVITAIVCFVLAAYLVYKIIS